MNIVRSFIARYEREYDYYQRVAELASAQLDAALQAAGIRAITTSRAKNPLRLEAKCLQRNAQKPYVNMDAIVAVVVDLAGVRVALYFPGDREKVGAIVDRVFEQVREPKFFPLPAGPSAGKRFAGYVATHYLVKIKEGQDVTRYRMARIEVQVASVLMHAWAEVEHDLLYKPMMGQLSEDEFATLDEVNGLVLAGEIALERLQRAMERRIGEANQPFNNNYELSAFIVANLPRGGEIQDSDLGRVDLLFEFLRNIGLVTPNAILGFLGGLDQDFERRPVADQITDRVLSEDETRYEQWETARRTAHLRALSASVDPTDGTLHEFLHAYSNTERLLKQLTENYGVRMKSIGGSINLLRQRQLVEPRIVEDLDRIQGFRNALVHGVEPVDTGGLKSASSRLREISEVLTGELGGEGR